MLKIQKLFLVAALSAVISGGVLAEGAKDISFDADDSYALTLYYLLVGGAGKVTTNADGSFALTADSLAEINLVAKEIGMKLDQTKVSEAVSDLLKRNVDEIEKVDMKKVEQKVSDFLQKVKDREAEIAKKAKTEGDKFRADFAKKDGVKSTKSGLLYRIKNAGKGEAIKPTDSVKVHYTGKLPDGTVFDSSRERGQPAEFRLDQVVKGWTEGLQLVKKGGKIELVLPPEIAYGKYGSGRTIPPNSTLYFDVEVLDVNPK